MWLANPLESPLLWPTAGVVGGIWVVALLGLLAKERRRLRTWRRSELFQRQLTWGWIAPTFTVCVLSGWLPTLALVALMVFQGLREYGRLTGLPRMYRWALLGAGLLVLPAALLSTSAFYVLPVLLFLVATLQPVLVQDAQAGVRHLAFAVFGGGYVAWLLGHLLLIGTHMPDGNGLLLALGLAVALSDIFAFVLGKAFGRHKLAPRLSPNKTWEGLAGNMVGASLGVLAMSFALPDGLPWYGAPLLAAAIGLGCAWGDLLESAIKRGAGVKDAGDWLQGFGGLLDRIDSMIIAAPLSYYLVLWMA